MTASSTLSHPAEAGHSAAAVVAQTLGGSVARAAGFVAAGIEAC
jgi:hypothetical protein